MAKQRFTELLRFGQNRCFQCDFTFAVYLMLRLPTTISTICSTLFQLYFHFFVLISFRFEICSNNCGKNHFVLLWFIRKTFITNICLHIHKTHIQLHTKPLFCSGMKKCWVWSFKKQSTHFLQNNSQFLPGVFMRIFAYTLHLKSSFFCTIRNFIQRIFTIAWSYSHYIVKSIVWVLELFF